ncbi:hypothetical protein ANN_16976 [Periplaneta americana]|uniref:Tc1-like transposase DDE domain-containing protein n=1 Tax=Periplaneta americana TaxID=6978 RepID=A0ABQ8SRM1_PERAM|nr:hypothetical protein ANN_16976 [Periplaneta americana]
MGAGFVLMNGNARAHVAVVSMNFLNEHEISVLDLPAISPNLNPIKHVWVVLESRIEVRRISKRIALNED